MDIELIKLLGETQGGSNNFWKEQFYVDIIGRMQLLTEQKKNMYLVQLTTILNLREVQEECLYVNKQGLIERNWTVDVLEKLLIP